MAWAWTKSATSWWNNLVLNYTEYDESQCEFLEIAPASELPDGGRLFVDIGDTPIVMFNLAGRLYAINDTCSHADCSLGDGELEDHEIICPCHGARFDVRTGKVLALPAVEDIPAYPVRVRDGTLEIGLPKK